MLGGRDSAESSSVNEGVVLVQRVGMAFMRMAGCELPCLEAHNHMIYS